MGEKPPPDARERCLALVRAKFAGPRPVRFVGQTVLCAKAAFQDLGVLRYCADSRTGAINSRIWDLLRKAVVRVRLPDGFKPLDLHGRPLKS